MWEKEGVYMWRLLAKGERPLLSSIRGCGQQMLVCPPVVAVVRRLGDLRLLLDGGVLAALSSAALSVLLQVVVQDLGVGLLVRGENVHEGGGGVASSSGGVDGTPTPQSRGQAEGGGRCASVETLLIKGLCLCINRP